MVPPENGRLVTSAALLWKEGLSLAFVVTVEGAVSVLRCESAVDTPAPHLW